MFPHLILSDFDGTLTSSTHQITPELFDICTLIHEHHSQFIIVSGRSMSWGHFLLTHFPIDMAIMEGGGVILSKENGLIQTIYQISDENRLKLKDLTEEFQRTFPPTLLSADSFGRATDRAVELGEMAKEEGLKAKVVDFLLERGANFYESNVHVNFWYGTVSKWLTVEQVLQTHLGNATKEDCIYFGDAPNDQSMFEHLPHTVGVANIAKYLPVMDHKPSVILTDENEAGPSGVLAYLRRLAASA
jgi:HAD superfamily hydrolase (TIGR01484 family)